jgi:hypothetical protein
MRAIGQFGSTVCVGLLLDTLIVRTLLMPSMATLVGRWFWWPQVVHPRGASNVRQASPPQQRCRHRRTQPAKNQAAAPDRNPRPSGHRSDNPQHCDSVTPMSYGGPLSGQKIRRSPLGVVADAASRTGSVPLWIPAEPKTGSAVRVNRCRPSLQNSGHGTRRRSHNTEMGYANALHTPGCDTVTHASASADRGQWRRSDASDPVRVRYRCRYLSRQKQVVLYACTGAVPLAKFRPWDPTPFARHRNGVCKCLLHDQVRHSDTRRFKCRSRAVAP